MTTSTAPQAQESTQHTQGPARHLRRYTRGSPAGEVVLGYLNTQVGRLSSLDMAVRRGKPGAVHQMRVTVRRLRAALQAYPAVLSGPETKQLRDELKWLGGVLGEARDTEVLADHLHASLAAVPSELVLGPAQARITVYFAAREARARSELLEALDADRYRALRAGLDRLLQRPPLTPEAAEPAGQVLPQAVARACKRAGRRMRQAQRAPAGHKRDTTLHQTRKAAKRVRYAAEAAAPGLGRKTGRKASLLARRMKRVQSDLGDHQDAVLARAVARDIGVQAQLAGESAFSFGLLHERAHHQAISSEQHARRSWKKARRQVHRSWLPRS